MHNMKTYSIEECCDILDGKRVPLNAEERSRIPGDIPYYGANGVQGYISKYIFDEPLVLLAEDGGNFEDYDKRPIAYRIYGRSWVNNHAHVLRAKKGFNQDLIFFNLVHKNILKYIAGGTRSKLTKSEMEKITISLPENEDVQTRLASIFNLVEEIISQSSRKISKLENIKVGMMQDLFTRGVDKNGELRLSYEKNPDFYKVSELGMIPKEWSVGQLGNLVEFYSGYAFKNKELSENGIKIIRISNLSKPNFPYWRYQGKIRESIVADKGDILFTWAGVASSIDIHWYRGEKALLNQHIYNFKNQDKNLLYYIYYYIKKFLPKLREEIEGGAGQLHLTKDKIESIYIPLPQPSEMKAILDKMLLVDSLINQEKSELNKYIKIKAGLMQDLLTGKVQVKA